MRRTVLYTAGLMIAAGASLALAGPASAASSSVPKPNWNPYTYYAPTQGLAQTALNNQVVLNNVGNPQIGFGNVNGGGSASATNWTNQQAIQSIGGIGF